MGMLDAASENPALHHTFIFPPSPPELSPIAQQKEDEGLPLVPVSEHPTEILDIDLNTADAHVPRDKRVVRLTGNHPFNVEAPLPLLYDKGFLTPPELFYVRNHGAVPKVEDTDLLDWEFSVEGLVEQPCVLSVKELMGSEFPQVTLPITLVCAGNRRKEQNMVRKSQGFSWGPAGVSTSLFTGVLLADLLDYVKPTRKARYLCMEGADKLPNGHYGTSVKLCLANDPSSAIMLAYKMNGEMLTPDHGKPLRVVVPGQIGGRSVKWLKRIIITDKPSENWYHIHDNRVLPTMVPPSAAKYGSDWWTDERYAIFDLNVNSALAYPAHEETLEVPVAGSGDGTARDYEIKGYAYSGGGRRVTRVEVSLDKGRSWRLAEISYPEDSYRSAKFSDMDLYGGKLDMSWRDRSYCWCFWQMKIAVAELVNAKDIVVRSMDEAMNLQPRDMYWNILGMMNNPWFRVKIEKDPSGRFITFKHPTQPGTQVGGWMEETKKKGGDLQDGLWGEQEEDSPLRTEDIRETKQDQIVMTNPDNSARIVEIDELRQHQKNPEESCWFVVEGEVFEGVKFLTEHPGGVQSITSAAGQDVTEEFMAIHSENARGMMPEYHIGRLSPAARKALKETVVDEPESATFLNPRVWTKASLAERTTVSKDTRIFTFKFPDTSQPLGLPVGQHLMIKLKDARSNDTLVRAYTPVSRTDVKGQLELLVKVYFDSASRPGGKMSQALDAMQIGQDVEVKGPIGKLVYHSRGSLTLSNIKRHVKKLHMICGGTGITPIFQVLRAVMEDPEDETKCTVLYGNRKESDILCRNDLDNLQALDKRRCKIFHTLTQPTEEWGGLRGRIDAGKIAECLDLRSGIGQDDELVLLCGPELMEADVKRVLGEMGWKAENICVF